MQTLVSFLHSGVCFGAGILEEPGKLDSKPYIMSPLHIL
jgi:hypothetical protein